MSIYCETKQDPPFNNQDIVRTSSFLISGYNSAGVGWMALQWVLFRRAKRDKIIPGPDNAKELLERV